MCLRFSAIGFGNFLDESLANIANLITSCNHTQARRARLAKIRAHKLPDENGYNGALVMHYKIRYLTCLLYFRHCQEVITLNKAALYPVNAQSSSLNCTK